MFMVGCFASLGRGQLEGRTNILSRGKQTALFLLTLIMCLFLQVQLSWSATTLYGAFAGAGIWGYNGTNWTQATPNTPQSMVILGSSLYGSFTGGGIWQYNGTTWSQVTPNTPTMMAVSGSTLYGAFAGGGIWQYNGTTWSQVTPNTPTMMAVSGSILYGAFAGGGIWMWNGSTWSQVTPNTPTIMSVSGSTLYGAFTGGGIWKYNGTTWTQVTPNTPTMMAVSGSTLYGAFAGGGIWGYTSSTWSQVTPNTPAMMAVSGSTLYGAFAGGGIWQWNGSMWSQVTPNDPTIMAAIGSINMWTWVSGSKTANQIGSYGTEGVAAAGNRPGARGWFVSWIDSSGNLWIFGGNGYDSAGTNDYLNDLWKYDGTNWTWVSGSNTVDQKGTYGTEGVAAVGNVPGAREGSVSWTDSSGNLWLFGGWGYDSAGIHSYLNDLWKYNGTNWTWVSGSNTVDQKGTYGTEGVAAVGNVPGARQNSVSWTDSSGNLWLFGGLGYDSKGNYGDLNDLWKYNGTNWTWVSGSNTADQSGSYGTKGVAAAGNVPGARYASVSWTDSSGNLWLFGGNGCDSAGNRSNLNDLWKFNGTNWTWVSGSNTINQDGSYGTEGVTAAGNVPGARDLSVSWTDSSGNLWLFGGYGYDSAGSGGDLNDLWKFNGTNWTWVSGSKTVKQFGSYGTEGVAAAGNVPGARYASVSWIDSSGNLWLFGGYGYDSVGNENYLNDLWRYQP
jgi:N-acetylneuraminic acid mutarotase